MSQLRVKAEDKKNFFAGMTFSTGGGQIKRGAPDYIVKATKFPSRKPAFNDIKVDSDGNILVHIFRKNRKEMYRYFDAFSPDGNFINNVQIVGDIGYPASRWVSIFKRSFWLVIPGEDELPRLIRYRISE